MKSCLQGLCYGEKLCRRWELARLDNEPQISQALLSGGATTGFVLVLFLNPNGNIYSWETYSIIIIFFNQGSAFDFTSLAISSCPLKASWR